MSGLTFENTTTAHAWSMDIQQGHFLALIIMTHQLIKLFDSHYCRQVGIGTVTPQNKLDVNGPAVIGASYVMNQYTATTNGLLVEATSHWLDGAGEKLVVSSSGTDVVHIIGTGLLLLAIWLMLRLVMPS